MTKGEKIHRLEQLLARVRTHAAQPRGSTDVAQSEPEVSATAEAPPNEGHDSRERLVVAAEAAEAEPPVAEAAGAVHESVPPIDVADVEVAADLEVAEDDEQPPVSSRRAVASAPDEGLAQMAFGADEPRQPLHTPPPESGRLPAAVEAEFDPDADFTGVRTATPLLPRRTEEPLPRQLVPHAIRPELAPSDVVGEIIAEAQRFAPVTFVALLDASLNL